MNHPKVVISLIVVFISLQTFLDVSIHAKNRSSILSPPPVERGKVPHPVERGKKNAAKKKNKKHKLEQQRQKREASKLYSKKGKISLKHPQKTQGKYDIADTFFWSGFILFWVGTAAFIVGAVLAIPILWGIGLAFVLLAYICLWLAGVWVDHYYGSIALGILFGVSVLIALGAIAIFIVGIVLNMLALWVGGIIFFLAFFSLLLFLIIGRALE